MEDKNKAVPLDDMPSNLSGQIVDENDLPSSVSSPKPSAHSPNGGGSGAAEPPLTSTSASEGSELGSWTTEANPLKNSKPSYEPSNFGQILEKAKIGVINPDLDEVASKSKPINVDGVEVSIKGGEAPPMALNVPKKEVDQDIDLLTKRTNVVRKMREVEIDKANQFKLGLEQLQQKGAALNEEYKANPTPELEAELNQTVKDLQDTEKAYNRAAFAQDVYEKRIVQTSDSIKKLANDKVSDNFYKGVYQGMKGNLDSWGESYDLATLGKAEQIQFAKDMATKAPTQEASGGGGVGEMIGGVIPDVLTAIGFSLAGQPVAGAATVAVRQGAQQGAQDFVRAFNEAKQGIDDGNGGKRIPTDDEAYDIATKAAGFGTVTGAVEGLVGVMGGGKVIGALASKAKTAGGKVIAEKVLDASSDAVIAGGLQAGRNAFDQYQGLDTKITEGVAENMAGELMLSGGVAAVTTPSQYSAAKRKEATKEVFKAVEESKSNPYELQKLQSNLDVLKNQGMISDIDYNELNKKAEQYIKVVETIPTEVKDKQKAADLILERDELEAKKESVDKAFQKPIDEKINAINEELVLAMQSIGQTDEKVEPTAPKILSVSEISQLDTDKDLIVETDKLKQLATPEAEAGLTPKTETDGKERREEEAKDVLIPTTETAGVVEAAPIELNGDEIGIAEMEGKNPKKVFSVRQFFSKPAENIGLPSTGEPKFDTFVNDNKDNTTEQDVSISEITPTQEILDKSGIGGKLTKGNPKVVKFNDGIFILDGHHRIATEANKGNSKVKADVITIDQTVEEWEQGEINKDLADVNIQQPMGESKVDDGAVGDVAKEELPKEEEVKPIENVEGFEAGVKIFRAGKQGRYFTTDKQYIQEGGFKGETREFGIPKGSNLLDLREKDYKGILDLATKEEKSILRKSQAKNSKEAKEQGDVVDNILKRNNFDGFIIKDAGETKDFDTVVFRKDKSPDKEQSNPTPNEVKNPTPPAVNIEVPKPSIEVIEDDNKVEVKGKVKEKAAKGFISVALNKLTKSLKDFQGRGKEYSQQTYDRIVNEAKSGALNISSIPPIQIWKDKSGNWVILGGHSRTKAFEDLAAGKHELNPKYKNSDFANISAQIVEANTLEEAQKIAQESNQGAVQTVVDNAKYVREKLMPTFKSFNDAKTKLRDLYGAAWTRIYAYANLNPNGKAMTFLKAFSENLESESTDISRKMAEWTGKAMSDFKGLTAEHENEIFDYLLENNKIKTYNEFYDILNRRINGIDGFVASEPLNFGAKDCCGY
jgi:hypothetical protein